ncbi:MAG: hypothetical protein A3F67_00730 [Verrucomicrobia bacterium RIFCSPHIGHO2_12_FULL_41_10]|nr:MAG: hypothetical protein A3F67_00730 [Verrucomicrobia bacterium RIFCSPHIGHO2_12_FULL_41_10]HLB33870.1 hypothetical protein [Chthoniobacterales bacterium]
MWIALFAAFGLGFLYFISAIPAAVIAGAPLWAATFFAWLGYSAGGGVVLLLGEPLRSWLLKKSKNLPSNSTDPANCFVAPVLEASSSSCHSNFSAPSTPCPSSASATLKTGSKKDSKPGGDGLFWRIWKSYGVIGVGFIAPITIGPQLSALLLLALGEKPWRILGWLSVGALPWALGLAFVVKFGIHIMSS